MLFKRWLPYLIPWIDVLLRTTERWKRRYYAYRVRRQVRTMGDGLWIGGPTELSENTVLGDNTHFTGMKVSGNGRVEIGDNFHSGPGSKIRTTTHNYDNGTAIPYDETWIEEGAIIQAGSVVVDDIPKYAIAGGHPAEVFKYRDENHYERLKREGEFH